MTDAEQAKFWTLANAYAASTLDTPRRAGELLKFVEDLEKAARAEGAATRLNAKKGGAT